MIDYGVILDFGQEEILYKFLGQEEVQVLSGLFSYEMDFQYKVKEGSYVFFEEEIDVDSGRYYRQVFDKGCENGDFLKRFLDAFFDKI